MAKRDPRIVKSEAAIALDKGKHKKALQSYLELEELEPDDGEWPRRSADMYRRLGQHKLAIAALERAADRYMRAGFLVKAIAVCKMILQLEPSHSGVQQRLAALNEQRGLPPGRTTMGDSAGGEAGAGRPVAVEPLPVPDVEPQAAPAEPAPAAPEPAPAAAPPPAVAPRIMVPPVIAPPAVPSAQATRASAPSLPTAASAPPPLPTAASGPPPLPTAARPPAPPPRRPRTIPPDAPLDAVSLGDMVPGAIPELTLDGQDSGIIEIPIELEADYEGESSLRPADERVLRETPLLSSLGPDAMRRLVAEVSLVELSPGQLLFREGEPGHTLYVIAEGAVSVISEGPPRKHLSTLQEGDFFGEIALVTNHARSATIEAHPERGAHLLAIDRKVIASLIDAEPGVLQALLRFLRDRLVDRLIHTSPLFAPYAGDEGRHLASLFRFLEVQPGAVVMQQGSKAAGLYVLLAGQLDAVRSDGGAERRLGALGPGGICGETSLLAGQPAYFTVRAASKAFVLQLPADTFREVIMTHPQVLMFVSELAEERRERYQAIANGDADYDTDRISLL